MQVNSEPLIHCMRTDSDLLDGQWGAILHEIGHYVASNADGPVRGHLIVHACSQRAVAGFVPDDASAALLELDRARWAFTASAGLLAEYHFCGMERPQRAQADIIAYQSVFGPASANEIVACWKHDHLARIGVLASYITVNFERCVKHCRSERFLHGDYHVIPSCMLQSPQRRGLSTYLEEIALTYPSRRRNRALGELLVANSNFQMNSKRYV